MGLISLIARVTGGQTAPSSAITMGIAEKAKLEVTSMFLPELTCLARCGHRLPPGYKQLMVVIVAACCPDRT